MKKLNFLYILIAVSLLAACETDDDMGEDSGLKADFSFTVDQDDPSVFKFTNLSEGATSYRWDFGDLNFYCEKENPTYKYVRAGGEVDVTLTAINESGQEAYITKTITAPEVLNVDIEIDGDFEDWEKISVLYDESESGTGTMQKIKMYGKGDYINVYIEGNTAMKFEVVDLYINADGNSSTGLLSWQWPNGSGADFLAEGAFLNNGWGDWYSHNNPSGEWGWNYLTSATTYFTTSGVVNVDSETNAIEFKIPKSALGSLNDTVSLAISELNAGWAGVADFPMVTSSSAFVTYELPADTVSLCE